MKTLDHEEVSAAQGADDERKKIWDELDSGGDAAPEVDPAPEGKQDAKQDAAPTPPAAADAAPPAADKAAEGKEEQGAPKADPFEGLPQSVRDELAGLRQQVEALSRRTRNAEGKLGELNGRLSQETAKQVRAEGGDAPSREELRAAQGDSEATKQLLEEYPEFGAAMLAALKEQLQALQPAKRDEDAAPSVTPEDLARLRVEMEIERVHPKWTQTVAQPAFAGWLERQPREVQMLARSTDAEDAIRLLDLHKASVDGGAPKQRQAQESAAAMPGGRPAKRGASSKPIDQMTREEYWEYLNQMDNAKARRA